MNSKYTMSKFVTFGSRIKVAAGELYTTLARAESAEAKLAALLEIYKTEMSKQCKCEWGSLNKCGACESKDRAVAIAEGRDDE